MFQKKKKKKKRKSLFGKRDIILREFKLLMKRRNNLKWNQKREKFIEKSENVGK